MPLCAVDVDGVVGAAHDMDADFCARLLCVHDTRAFCVLSIINFIDSPSEREGESIIVIVIIIAVASSSLRFSETKTLRMTAIASEYSALATAYCLVALCVAGLCHVYYYIWLFIHIGQHNTQPS